MTRSETLLGEIFEGVREDFARNRRIMSFSEFIDAVVEHPTRHARSAAQYLRDCFAHLGAEARQEVWGEVTRYRLFDAPFDEENPERMLGQERAQQRFYQLLDGFVRSGRVDKLILLHGPNGSAKSTFVKALMRALEHYSGTDEGAAYRFNWIFPIEKLSNAEAIGFGTSAVTKDELTTFAHLDEELISARLSDSLHDHPLLLLPVAQRQVLLERAFEQADAGDFVISDYIARGDLSHTNRLIFDALLAAYKGDLESVLKHVQVERFFVSRRYRRGAVTVEPKMRADASVRQLTVDRSLQSLPPMLQNLTLVEPFGDLVDANRGVIEYDDLFKRNPELNKYLLSVSERASVSLDALIVHLDTMLVATANETYLDAFKQTAEYASFKGRVELVRLPYLLDYDVEREIYAEQLARTDVGKFIAPHTTYVAALWAVLTRLKRPQADAYPPQLRDAVSSLTPLEKADLYARGEAPERLSAEVERDLRNHVREMMDEAASSAAYEGRYGASPREMKMILLNAAQAEGFPCLSPLAVFEELEQLVKDPSVFPFLQMKPDGPYRRHDAFIETVRERYLDLLDEEVQDAMGLVEEKQYEDLFTRYIDHVSQWLKGEDVYNAITGNYESPDEKFMEEIEESMGVEEDSPRSFREGLISSIGASFIDNPDSAVDYRRIFPRLFGALKRSFYEERVKTIRKIQEHLLVVFEGDADQLTPQERELAEQAIENLCDRFGHTRESAREAVAFLLSKRYKDEVE